MTLEHWTEKPLNILSSVGCSVRTWKIRVLGELHMMEDWLVSFGEKSESALKTQLRTDHY